MRAALKKAIKEERIVKIEGSLKYKISLNEKKLLMKRKSIQTNFQKTIKIKINKKENNNKNKIPISNQKTNQTKKIIPKSINTIKPIKSIQSIKSKTPISTSKSREMKMKRMMRILKILS